MPATMHYNKLPTYAGNTAGLPLSQHVAAALEGYFAHMGDQVPENVYELVLNEIELPLLQAVMKYCRYNQSKAAQVLGLNRGTFRKKLEFYGLL